MQDTTSLGTENVTIDTNHKSSQPDESEGLIVVTANNEFLRPNGVDLLLCYRWLSLSVNQMWDSISKYTMTVEKGKKLTMQYRIQ